jgi:hypothetical protein
VVVVDVVVVVTGGGGEVVVVVVGGVGDREVVVLDTVLTGGVGVAAPHPEASLPGPPKKNQLRHPSAEL